MKVPLRRFTTEGMMVVGQQLDMMRAGNSVNLGELIDNRSLTVNITSAGVIEDRAFKNRFECAEFLHQLLDAHSSEIPNPAEDAGLWTWLAIFFREQLFATGTNKLGINSRWVSSTEYRVFYRHLLAGPYYIYHAHKDNPSRALVVLCTPLSAPGDIVEQIASRQDIVRFPSLMEVTTKLFYDPSTGRPKVGAANKKGTGGTARRFVDVLKQFDLTFDFYGMTSDQILALLPAEFDRFLNS
jgi:hypothetical protein